VGLARFWAGLLGGTPVQWYPGASPWNRLHTASGFPSRRPRPTARTCPARCTTQPCSSPNRAAAHTNLNDPVSVALLLGSLRELGAVEQVTVLVTRLPAAGMFQLSLNQGCR
jgi:hypothetical protein